MSTKLLYPSAMSQELVVHRVGGQLANDFVSGDAFTAIAADAGSSVAKVDTAGGAVAATTGGTDNNEAYIKGSSETLLFAANKLIEFLARVQYSEANTDDANVIVGVSNAVAANELVDDGAGPRSNYYGFNVHKVDGGTVWICEASIGTTQYTTTSTSTAGGSSPQSFRIVFRPEGSDTATVSFEIDTAGGVNFTPMCDSAGSEIVHRLTTLGTPTEMQIGIGVKAGGANSEVLNASFAGAEQRR